MKVSDKKIQLLIGGMNCINCQNRIEKKLKQTKGIISASVSFQNGTADIIYNEGNISQDRIKAVIEAQGYKVLTGAENRRGEMVRTACILAIIVILYIALMKTGVLNLLVPSRLADTKMGYGMLFVIGLLTSVHCIAMCGGINLSQSIPKKRESESFSTSEKSAKTSEFLSTFFYNIGRVLSYTVIGFVLGLVGFLIGGNVNAGVSTVLQGIIKIAAGLCMILMGIHMLGIFPSLRKFTIRMPEAIVRKIGKETARNSRPFLIGILNGFMPCGPLQAMWVVAIAAGSPFAGALSMLLFGLGTLPLMLGLGSLVAALGRKFADKVMTAGAVLVVVFGLAMLSQGGALCGFRIQSDIQAVEKTEPEAESETKSEAESGTEPEAESETKSEAESGTEPEAESGTESEAELEDGVQTINSTLTARKYPDITVQAGIPVKWVIDVSEDSLNGCNYKMIIQDYDIEYTFHTGENVIEFTPTQAGTVQYSCWMGMIYGNIYVTEEK